MQYKGHYIEKVKSYSDFAVSKSVRRGLIESNGVKNFLC